MAYPQASYHPAAQPGVGHPGMFAPGTKVQVGQHRVIVEKYLSEGGFAHVYVVRIPREGNKYDPAVLKRVAVPDKDTLANMRTEVETMKKLKGHKHIVSYIDSHASQLKGGGYEVFLLMEFCQGGGLIDFMNTRLQHRLTEPEILKIFSDVAEGVACMHYLKPPLLHRDLKVENVLISASGSSRTYKLCDFGSTAPPRPAASSAQEARLIEDDVQRHTTMQYRSPEMVDVYRKQAINEKSDIWALGVLLYKLCYYTTPFEEQGQMAILNASFKYPHHPSFSERLKKLIGAMLKEHPNSRPNIYQVITEVCSMRNTNVPIKDIYSARSQSEARGFEALPTKEKVTSPGPVIGLAKVESKQDDRAAIPEIAPMRRGRPIAGSQLNVPSAATPASSRPTSADPFAALDAKLSSRKQPPPDELSERFPSLQEFSILHEKGAKFEFDQSASDGATASKAQNLDTRVTHALADEAFGQLRHAKSADIRPNRPDTSVARSASLKKPSVPAKEPARVPSRVQASGSSSVASPIRSGMVSTGVQTSPATSPQIGSLRTNIRDRPIWRVPQSNSPALNPRDEETLMQRPQLTERKLPNRPEPLSKTGLLSRNRTKSQAMQLELPTSPVSSRPSLEGSRPSLMEISDPNGTRSRSANAQLRQVSANVDAAMEDLPSERDSYRTDKYNSHNATNNESSDDEVLEKVESATDFLRSREVESSSRPKVRHRSSSASKKRLSLPAISLSGTRNMLSGKFGDAFKRFESNTNEEQPINDRLGDEDMLNRGPLSPVAGSVGKSSQGEEEAIDETEDLSPEFRRELERRRLSQEEKRVAAAAAEYRQRLQQGGAPSAGPRQVSSIQSRIQNYVDQSRSAAPPPRTAEGYGKFTDESNLAPTPSDRPFIAKKPHNMPMPTKTLTAPAAIPLPVAPRLASTLPLRTGSPRPNVAPKPQALRTGGPTVGLARPPNGNSPLLQMSATEEEDDSVLAFTKKFPGLDNFDLVDMEFEDPAPRSKIGMGMKPTNGTNGTMRVRDV